MLARLVTENFRNLEPLAWEAGAGRHLLLGDNGSGKTSVLEAIYLLATTRSFRAANLLDCCRAGTTRFLLRGDVSGNVRTTLAIEWSSRIRRRTLNGKTVSLTEHVSALPVLAWTAAEATLLTGAPTARRRFLDRGLITARPGALDALQRYREALLQKRQLLQTGGEEIGAWNDILAELGAVVIQLRSSYLARLRRAFEEVLTAAESRFAGTELVYKPSPVEGAEGAQAFRARLERSVGTERARRLPLLGPHRDEVTVLWRGQEIRRIASAGERKLLGLSLLAAQARLVAEDDRAPLVLLDDADAELDRKALARAWRGFLSLPQLFASSNRPEVFEGLDITRRWHLEEGRLSGT